jgi:cytochrome o ubiquinol oxidase subunit 1
MLGRLTLSAIPFDQPIIMGAFGFMGLIAVSVVGALTYFRKWNWLWTEWLTSVDHKKIGVMYIMLAIVMLLRGFSDAIMMRTQLAVASGGSPGYLPPEHYDQIFTAHGVIMIFFMAMPFVIGLMNVVVPLQIGARDFAFPFLNSLSLWLLDLPYERLPAVRGTFRNLFGACAGVCRRPDGEGSVRTTLCAD